MNRPHWRRFLPRRKVQTPRSSDVLDIAAAGTVSDLNAVIEHQKSTLASLSGANKKVALENLLILQTPRAALSQRQMDEHAHGYHNREKRLYELIDFNDAFVSTVLALDHEEVKGYADRLKQKMIDFCKSMHTPMFSDEQFEAIVRGLSREIAVYRGARAEGFDAQMTSRTDDAFGIDMVITDRQSHRSINIDCKTPSAFRYRLEELIKEGKLTDDELLQADEQDYCITPREDGDKHILVTIMCIRPERLGDVTGFSFDDTAPLAALLREIMTHTT